MAFISAHQDFHLTWWLWSMVRLPFKYYFPTPKCKFIQKACGRTVQLFWELCESNENVFLFPPPRFFSLSLKVKAYFLTNNEKDQNREKNPPNSPCISIAKRKLSGLGGKKKTKNTPTNTKNKHHVHNTKTTQHNTRTKHRVCKKLQGKSHLNNLSKSYPEHNRYQECCLSSPGEAAENMHERHCNTIEICAVPTCKCQKQVFSSHQQHRSTVEVLKKRGIPQFEILCICYASVHCNCPIAYNKWTVQVQLLLPYGWELQNQELIEENTLMVLGKEKNYTCYAKRADN